MDKTEVIITDITIPFWSIVMFMVKVVIAVIPALIILLLVTWAYIELIDLVA